MGVAALPGAVREDLRSLLLHLLPLLQDPHARFGGHWPISGTGVRSTPTVCDRVRTLQPLAIEPSEPPALGVIGSAMAAGGVLA